MGFHLQNFEVFSDIASFKVLLCLERFFFENIGIGFSSVEIPQESKRRLAEIAKFEVPLKFLTVKV